VELFFSSSEENIAKYLKNVSGYHKHFLFDDHWSGEIKIDKDGFLVEINDTLNNDPLNKEEFSYNRRRSNQRDAHFLV
jgi:hypothetical protein